MPTPNTGIKLSKAFYIHSGVFFAIGVGLIILTIAFLWLLAVIGHASADY